MSRKEPTDAEWRVMAVEGIEAGEPPLWPSLVIRLLDRLARRAPGDRGLREALEAIADWAAGSHESCESGYPDCPAIVARAALAADSRPEQPREADLQARLREALQGWRNRAAQSRQDAAGSWADKDANEGYAVGLELAIFQVDEMLAARPEEPPE